MKYRLFQYRLPADPELADLNAFLAQNRIATVTQQIVRTSGGDMLVFVVEIASSQGQVGSDRATPRIDYRNVLSESEFAVFSQLRDERKQLATEEGVPVYAIFSNAQLAEMVQKNLTTLSELAKIPGLQKTRVEKYADRILPILTAAFQASTDGSDEGSES